MEISFSIVSFLYIIGAAQGAFLASALLSYRNGNRLANRYLGLLTLVFVLALIDYFFDETGLINQYVWIRTVLWPKEFLYGILIYFYVRELTLPQQFALAGKQWLHFIPAVLHVLLTWPLLLLDQTRQLQILTEQANSGFDVLMSLILGPIELYLTIIQITVYLVLSLRLIQQHNRRIRQTFSDIEKINLIWLSRFLFGIFIVYFIWLVKELASTQLQQESLWEALLGGSMVFLIYGMGYLGLKQPIIFNSKSTLQSISLNDEGQTSESNNDSSSTEREKKYKNSPLSAELIDAFGQELESFMQSDKPYLDNQISLPDLAQRLNMSINYLSQVINQHSGNNFFDFINKHRINEAQKLLSEESAKKLNILDLSMQVGFNSKSAFYNAFKKHTGMTPTEYRSQLGASSV